MNCKHCGKSLPENAKYCPNCAEPTDCQSEYLNNTPEEDLSNALAKRAIKGFAIASTVSFVISIIIVFMVNQSISCFLGYFFSALFFCLIFVVIDLMIVRNNDRKTNIITQFERDTTNICPRCGSHSIKIYRKGYNYNEAFWGNMFNIKGSRYTAGMNSNNAMCHCQHCGHNWNSGYDYRQIK